MTLLKIIGKEYNFFPFLPFQYNNIVNDNIYIPLYQLLGTVKVGQPLALLADPLRLSSTPYRNIECGPQATGRHGIDPPPIRRGSEETSGTPSGMMA